MAFLNPSRDLSFEGLIKIIALVKAALFGQMICYSISFSFHIIFFASASTFIIATL